MIYELSKEIAIELAAKGMPYRVVYGPERAPKTMADPRVVIERRREPSDVIEDPKARTENPRTENGRWIACRARVFARVNLAGAAVYDHERECDEMVDKVTIALRKCCMVRKNFYRFGRAGLVSAEALKLDNLEGWPGVVYDVAFEVHRGVTDTTWTGAKSAEATMGGAHGVSIKTTVTASGQGGAVADNELPSATTRIGN
jgi:hypothetical protein